MLQKKRKNYRRLPFRNTFIFKQSGLKTTLEIKVHQAMHLERIPKVKFLVKT